MSATRPRRASRSPKRFLDRRPVKQRRSRDLQFVGRNVKATATESGGSMDHGVDPSRGGVEREPQPAQRARLRLRRCGAAVPSGEMLRQRGQEYVPPLVCGPAAARRAVGGGWRRTPNGIAPGTPRSTATAATRRQRSAASPCGTQGLPRSGTSWPTNLATGVPLPIPASTHPLRFPRTLNHWHLRLAGRAARGPTD